MGTHHGRIVPLKPLYMGFPRSEGAVANTLDHGSSLFGAKRGDGGGRRRRRRRAPAAETASTQEDAVVHAALTPSVGARPRGGPSYHSDSSPAGRAAVPAHVPRRRRGIYVCRAGRRARRREEPHFISSGRSRNIGASSSVTGPMPHGGVLAVMNPRFPAAAHDLFHITPHGACAVCHRRGAPFASPGYDALHIPAPARPTSRHHVVSLRPRRRAGTRSALPVAPFVRATRPHSDFTSSSDRDEQPRDAAEHPRRHVSRAPLVPAPRAAGHLPHTPEHRADRLAHGTSESASEPREPRRPDRRPPGLGSLSHKVNSFAGSRLPCGFLRTSDGPVRVGRGRARRRRGI